MYCGDMSQPCQEPKPQPHKELAHSTRMRLRENAKPSYLCLKSECSSCLQKYVPYPPPLQPENSPPIKLLLVRLAKPASLIRLYPQNLHDSAVHHKPCFHAQLSVVNMRFQGTVASPSEIPGCSVCPCLLSIPLMPLSGQSLEPVC